MSQFYNYNDVKIPRDELVQVSSDEIQHGKLVDCYFLMERKQGKPFILAKPGEFIDDYLISKIKNPKFTTLLAYSPINQHKKEIITNLLTKLLHEKIEKEKKKLVSKYLKIFFSDFFHKSHETILTHISSFHAVFNRHAPEMLISYAAVSKQSYLRAMEIAFFASVLGMIDGFFDGSFIADVYNLALYADYQLVKNEFTVFMEKAIELENQSPGTGLEYLKSYGREKEYQCLEKHGITAIETIDKTLVTCQITLKMLKQQSERSNGKGFPLELSEKDQLNWECFIAFAECFVPKANDEYMPGDASNRYEEVLKHMLGQSDLKNVRMTKKIQLVKQHFNAVIAREENVA